MPTCNVGAIEKLSREMCPLLLSTPLGLLQRMFLVLSLSLAVQKWKHAHGKVNTDTILDSGGPRLYGDVFRQYSAGELKTPAFVGAHNVSLLHLPDFPANTLESTCAALQVLVAIALCAAAQEACQEFTLRNTALSTAAEVL